MTSEKDSPPPVGTEARRQWAIQRAKKSWDAIIEAGGSDFEATGIINGDEKSISSSDAELFPDEPEEYKPEEKKPRLVTSPKK